VIQTDIPCSACKLPMIGIKLGSHYAIVCDKFGCGKYRQIQGSIERSTEFFTAETAPRTTSLPVERTPGVRTFLIDTVSSPRGIEGVSLRAGRRMGKGGKRGRRKKKH
jgi:hypothetical protein